MDATQLPPLPPRNYHKRRKGRKIRTKTILWCFFVSVLIGLLLVFSTISYRSSKRPRLDPLDAAAPGDDQRASLFPSFRLNFSSYLSAVAASPPHSLHDDPCLFPLLRDLAASLPLLHADLAQHLARHALRFSRLDASLDLPFSPEDLRQTLMAYAHTRPCSPAFAPSSLNDSAPDSPEPPSSSSPSSPQIIADFRASFRSLALLDQALADLPFLDASSAQPTRASRLVSLLHRVLVALRDLSLDWDVYVALLPLLDFFAESDALHQRIAALLIPFEERLILCEAKWAALPVPVSHDLPSSSSSSPSSAKRALRRLAVVVPLDPGQSASEDAHFSPHALLAYLRSNATQQGAAHLSEVAVIAVAQQGGGAPFNRGKLFNVGFDIASRRGFDCFVFHDAALRPVSATYLPKHRSRFETSPLHLATCVDGEETGAHWACGGAMLFDKAQFRAINGYSNEFWGAQGEDEDLALRIASVWPGGVQRLRPFCEHGKFADGKKDRGLDREHLVVRCRTDASQQYSAQLRSLDGLSSLNYETVDINVDQSVINVQTII